MRHIITADHMDPAWLIARVWQAWASDQMWMLDRAATERAWAAQSEGLTKA